MIRAYMLCVGFVISHLQDWGDACPPCQHGELLGHAPVLAVQQVLTLAFIDEVPNGALDLQITERAQSLYPTG